MALLRGGLGMLCIFLLYRCSMFSQIQDDREELRKHLVWLKDTVTFNVNKKTVRAGIGKVIEDGVDGWNRDSDARIVLKRGLDTSKGVDSLDRMNAICLGTPKLSDFSDLAATYVEHDDHDTVITDADIVLDLERIKRYCKLEMTVLHELGHLMGLQDVTS